MYKCDSSNDSYELQWNFYSIRVVFDLSVTFFAHKTIDFFATTISQAEFIK